jgi:hypothetical protein
MLKVHYQTDHEDLFKACSGQMVQLFEDRFVKSAASDSFSRDKLKEFAPDKDHFMLHLVAMGDQETYGPNKNGDGFPKSALEKFSNTFVTNGCFFREHRNRNAKTQGIGTVKAAAYNPVMHRTEIIVWGDREKAASEFEAAKNGDPLSFSMSCRVPYDTCSCCGNQAASPKDYCEHLKYGSMLQYQPEFKKYAFAINDKPTFFDISVVNKPADRIAHYLEYAFPNDTEKSASLGKVITGTQWAEYEGLLIPDNGVNWPRDRMHVLQKLAAASEYLRNKELIKSAGQTPKAAYARDVVPNAYLDNLTDEELSAFRNLEPGTFFAEMAKRASVLPFHSFVAYVDNRPIDDVKKDPMVKKALTIHLPGVFDNLMSSPMPDIGNIFDGHGDGACCYDSSNDDVVKSFMDKVEEKFSCKSEPVRARIIKIITIKEASEFNSNEFKNSPELNMSESDDSKAKALAYSYAIYKVAAMRDIERIHGDSIDEAQYMLVAF